MLEFLRDSIESACVEDSVSGYDESIPLSGVSRMTQAETENGRD